MRGEEEKESTFMYEDVVPLMSTLPLGSVSLTFMLDHTISLSLPAILSLPPFCTSLLLFFFTHYPVSSSVAPHESLAFTFAAFAVVAA